MAVVKIESNPYEKKVSFFKLDDTSNSWVPVNAVNNENSKLISSDLTDGFFPFKLKEIIDIINTEYEDVDFEDKIGFLVYVISRYRDNIFHGTKGIKRWFDYTDEIEICLELMERIIECHNKHNIKLQNDERSSRRSRNAN